MAGTLVDRDRCEPTGQMGLAARSLKILQGREEDLLHDVVDVIRGAQAGGD